MATNMFPKFQLSYFHGQGKSLQSVFRTDNKEEYDEKLAELLKEQEIDQTLKEATPDTKPAPTQTANETKPCPIHNTTMYYHPTGKYGPFWSHGNKESGYCNGTEKGNKISGGGYKNY